MNLKGTASVGTLPLTVCVSFAFHMVVNLPRNAYPAVHRKFATYFTLPEREGFLFWTDDLTQLKSYLSGEPNNEGAFAWTPT